LEDAIVSASSEPDIAKSLAELKTRSGRRTVRHIETLSVIPIYRKGAKPIDGGEPYKAYKGDSNYCYEIFRTEGGKWDGRVVSSFEAQGNEYKDFMKSSRYRTTTWSGEPLVMRVMADDFIAIEGVDDPRRLMRLQKIRQGSLYLTEHHEGNVDARTRDPQSGFSYFQKSPDVLRKLRARRVFVDPIGRVKDPGFRE
jgi:CRISPR-associated endonuclease Csn1